MTDRLIEEAISVVRPRQVGWNEMGQVGSALLTRSGNIYRGVCIDVSSSMGFCAEHAAIAAMVTAGEYEIDRVVAVKRSDDGAVHILAPCGRCREFMFQVDKANLDADVIVGHDGEMVKLRTLLPYSYRSAE
jgi:cytidine deaminase